MKIKINIDKYDRVTNFILTTACNLNYKRKT